MKKQSMKSKYHESSAAERKEHGYKKPKNAKKSYHAFEEREEEKMYPGIHKKIKAKAKGKCPHCKKVM